jgi:hypothetical protein
MTTHKSNAVLAGITPDYALAGVVLSRSCKFTPADDSIVSGDTIQMIPVPKGAQILGIDIFYTALPAGTTGADIGYGGDTDAFMSTLPLTAQNIKHWPGNALDNKTTAGLLHTFTAADTIDIALGSAATKIPTSTPIYMNVMYKMVGTIADET